MTGLLYRGLTEGVERPSVARAVAISPATRKIVARIAALFALDSLGGGFLTTALLALFFYTRFGVDEGVVGHRCAEPVETVPWQIDSREVCAESRAHPARLRIAGADPSRSTTSLSACIVIGLDT